jgi:uncharacterized protein YkwD
MELHIPARALAGTGATLLVPLMVLVGAGSAPISGSTTVSSGGHTSQVHVAVLAGASSARASSGGTTKRWAGSISVNRQAAVESAYVRDYASGLNTSTGYTGSDSECRPGTSSASSRAATLRAVNFVRAMSGLAPVRFSAALNTRSQRTALMMSANRALSHAPPRGWRCYNSIGAANAGRSNLALSYPSITSAGMVGLYMGEPGSGNAAVGHRRWLLNPSATTMGTGSTDTANAMTVIGPTAAHRPNPAWVSWPTAGYFPRPLEPGGRWSLSAGSRKADFRRATVRVYRNGKALRAVKLAVHSGYAMPTLVWQIPAAQAKSGTYRVVVRGVHRAGTRKVFGRTYDVRMFDPSN